MVPPMVVDDDPDKQTSHAWSNLWPVIYPCTFVEVHNRCDAFLTTGKFFCLAYPVEITCDATSIGREEVVVTATVARILSVEQNLTKVVTNVLG
jgi:hypothetical protein